MKKASFVGADRPLLCAMIQEKTVDDAIKMIQNCRFDGAEAFGIQMEFIERKYRNEEDLTRLMKACCGLPVYVTSYRGYESTGYTDDECMDYLLLCVKCGATLCDVMADTYDAQPDGITFDAKAIEKQKAIIKKIQEAGGEVVMSTHFPDFRDKETVYATAKAQAERGADMVKIVNFAHDDEQFVANVEMCVNLKNVTDKPYLFLTSGEKGRFLRQTGGKLGCAMYLCVYQYERTYSLDQPKLRCQKLIRDNMNL